MADSSTLIGASVNPSEVYSKTPAAGTLEEEQKIVNILEGYRLESEEARKTGLNPRDDKWRENLDLYWNRYDFSQKASWQAKEVMPEVPSFVDRLAAALKEALVQSPDGFYTVVDPADAENDLGDSLKKMLDMWLLTTGRNHSGTCLPFPAVFEEQVKMGALMACCSATTWKNDVEYGRVAIEAVDPRSFWLDHTYRDLYRRRRIEVDRHELSSMVGLKDSNQQPIFDTSQMAALISSMGQDQAQIEHGQLSGTGQNTPSTRQPVILDEYIATVVDYDGTVLAKDKLMVVANNRYLIRGPEANPYWHAHDWITYAPLVTVPLSPYGRSYMEDFGSLARTFNELTNMLLDAVHVSALKAFVMVPGALIDPTQATTGITPNKLFLLEEGLGDVKQFAAALDLGTLPPDALKMWQEMKQELREAAGINEIGIGQFAPKSRTSATEISSTSESSSAIVRGLAQTIEVRYLDPTLDLVWKTGLQHMKPDDKRMVAAIGKDTYSAIYSQRKELVTRPMTFQARGISTLIQRTQMLKNLLTVLQVVFSNPLMAQAFMQEADMKKLVDLIFRLSNIDVKKVTMSERDRMIQQITQPMQQAAAAGATGTTGTPAPGATGGEGKAVAQAMGVSGGQQGY